MPPATPSPAVQAIRTLALVGQTGGGKTSLAEALLRQAGAIGAPGSLERGTTVSDFDPLERRAAALAERRGGAPRRTRDTRIHLIDTPGLRRFRRPVDDRAGSGRDRGGRDQRGDRHRDDERAHDGVGGAARRCAGMIIVNKIDAAGRRPAGAGGSRSRPRSARSACRSTCRPAAARGSSTASSTRRARRDFSSRRGGAPRAGRAGGRGRRRRSSSATSNEGDVDPRELHAPLEQALREGHLIPICFVSARNGAGVAELLDVIERAAAQPGRGQPAAVPARAKAPRRSRTARRARPGEARDRARLQGHGRPVRRQDGRLPHPPGHGHAATASSTSATAASRSRSATCSCCRARTTSRCRAACRATSARSPRSTRCTSTRCCTTPPRTTTST